MKIFKRIKESFSSKKFRKGAYTTAISIFVIVTIVIINLAAKHLNIKIDLNKDRKYSLTKQTKELMKDTSDEIKLYYMTGEESQDSSVKQIVDQYDGVVKNIKVERKDPQTYPQFAKKYTEEEVTSNSVIVVNTTNDRSKVVPCDHQGFEESQILPVHQY